MHGQDASIANFQKECDPYLMYLNRICRVNMHGLEHPARRVGPNGDCTQVKGPILLPYLLEGATVACVASKPEAL